MSTESEPFVILVSDEVGDGLWHAAALAFCVTGFAALAVGLAIHSGDTVCMCLPVKP